jgi:hypothetical protein
MLVFVLNIFYRKVLMCKIYAMKVILSSNVKRHCTFYLYFFSSGSLPCFNSFSELVLQVLQERGESTSRHGRATFSVLLFQVIFHLTHLIGCWKEFIVKWCLNFTENLIVVKHNWLQYPIPLPVPSG